MLIVTDATIANRGALETRSLPRKFLGRVVLLPRGAGPGIWLRLVAEMQFLRYILVLLPFLALPLISRDLALPVMQAPLVMVMLVAGIELRVLRLSRAARARAADADTADRRLDMLAFRARAILRRIAARQGMTEGELHLVIEQSELARIPPLTLVSVQTDRPAPHVVALDAEDRDAVAGLFDPSFSERDLLAVNHRSDTYIRSIAQETRAVSAHARLAAALDRRAAAS